MDTRSGEVLAGGVVHKGGIERIYCVSDELALSAGSDGRLVIWSLSEPHRLRTIASSDGAIFAFALLSNARIAWGEHDGTVRIARLKDLEELAVFKLHKGTVTMLSAIWSSEALVSAAHDGRVRVWRPDDGSIVTEMQLDRPLSCGAVAPDASALVVGDISGGVHFLRLSRTNDLSGPNRRSNGVIIQVRVDHLSHRTTPSHA